MADNNLKQRVPWWKLEHRPKVDRYTMAGAQLLMGALFVFRHDPCCDSSNLLRYGGAAMALVSMITFWRARRMPTDSDQNNPPSALS